MTGTPGWQRVAAPRGPLPSVPTGVVAAVTLVLAFAVVLGTGIRALGGAVLLLGVAWCAWRALPAAGVVRVLAVVVLGGVCFAGAHVLAPALGAWLSVAFVAFVLAVGTTLLLDLRPSTP
ncbi:hypothetical protein [Cellulomonas sp. Marseille-Q8402]